jgi:putative transposase
MQLVEKHIIKKNHSFYNECDSLCFKSKNIYNLSLYKIKETIQDNNYEILNNLYHHIKNENCFTALPNKVSTETIRKIQTIYKGFFASVKDYSKNPSKYKGSPQQPKFLHKTKGRFIVGYNNQALSIKEFKKTGKVKLSQTNISLNTKIKKFEDIAMVRIIPRNNYYIIEIVYNKQEQPLQEDNGRYCAIDLGLENIATVTSNIKGNKPFLIKGSKLKNINQYYNKILGKKKSILEIRNNKKSSKKILKLTDKRNNKIDDYMHKASKYLVTYFQGNNISKVYVGKNDGWKQNINMGKVNNQSFVSVPHNKFIEMLSYKCKLKGIEININEESYTSKASFLDGDDIPKYNKIEAKSYKFSGKRVNRNLYISKEGKRINADVNASYNILKKCVPSFSKEGIEGFVVIPKIIKILN